MATTYSEEQVMKLLKRQYNTAESVIQYEQDYCNEFHILARKENGCFEDTHVEVVNTKVAISNEEDFASNKNEFLWDIIETLIDKKELTEIGCYKKLADNLYWREY